MSDGAAAGGAEPSTDTERLLAGIWGELFAREKIAIDVSFFELGGDSLLALRLMSRVQEETGRDLPLAMLFERGTIADLAAYLSEEEPQALQRALELPLVAIQPEGAAPPFYCVHPAGGNVLCYSALARALGHGRPFYALQAPGLERERDPILGVEALAAHYVQALLRAQPTGSYRLGGWSTGGVVAFEMARQLTAQGRAVALLVLFDTLAPAEFPERDEAELMLAFAGSLEVHFGAGSPLSAARFLAMSRPEQVAHLTERRKAAGTLASEAGDAEVGAQLRVFEASVRSIERYRPAPYGGAMLHFRAAERGGNRDSAGPWTPLVGQLEVEEAPGNHESMMFPPLVETLGVRLRAQLLAADEQPA